MLGFTSSDRVFAIEAKGSKGLLRGIGQALTYQQGAHVSYLACDAGAVSADRTLIQAKGVGVIGVHDDGRASWNEPPQSESAEAVADIRGQLSLRFRGEQFGGDLTTLCLAQPLNYLAPVVAIDCQGPLARDELVDRLRDLFERNVHVTRIPEPAAYEPTDRMLQRAETARNEIYREAAALLREYRASRRADPSALRALLDETTITPGDEERLFELYVLFQYVRAIEDLQSGDSTVATIETARQEVARVESDDADDVVLYRDNTARDRGLSFLPGPTVDEKADHELTRSERVRRESRRVLDRYFVDDRFEHHSNRPDVIVLEVRRDDRYEYLVTEVKHSTQPETIHDGVTETLEYLAFLRKDEQFVFEDDAPFGSGWNGVLVVQDIDDLPTAPLEEQERIRILQALELETALPQLLEHVL